MVTILSIPIILVLLLVQMVIIPSVSLLSGTADIILLVLIAWALHERTSKVWQISLIAGFMVGAVSALPIYFPMSAYLAVTWMTKRLKKYIWQTPILAMFFITIIGSLSSQCLSVVILQLSGNWLRWDECITQVILPGTLLNLLLSLPVYALVSDFTNWLYPIEV